MNMKNINIYILLLFAGTILVSCGYEPEVERAGSRPDLTTTEVLEARGYSILNEAIVHAGLDGELSGSDSLTILAPSDVAFEALLSNLGVQSITDLPSDEVAAILSYHVIGSPAFSDGLPRRIAALDGNNLYFSTVGDVSVNGKTTVVEPDMVSSTSVIHGINKVLDVPVGNLFQQMQANDSLTILVSAIEAAGLESVFTGSDEYTIFAPTNSAFEGIDLGAFSDEELLDILQFHVVSGVSFSQELPEEGRIATIQGNTVDDNVQEITKDGTALNGSELISLNNTANNGVFHIVETLVEKVSTKLDYLGTTVNASGLDNLFLDQFNSVVEGVGYEGFNSLADTLTFYPIWQGPTYGFFANDDDALDYIESHTFEGSINIFAQPNGTKVTAINGNEYYMVNNGDTTFTHNGAYNGYMLIGQTNPFILTSYNVTVGSSTGFFTPLPEENLVEVLEDEADYSLFLALVEKLELTATLSSGDYTVFPVNDAIFSSATFTDDDISLTTVEQIDTLDAEDDIALLEELAEVASNHVVEGANFAAFIVGNLPNLETIGETNLQFANVSGDPVIVLDPANPNTANIELLGTDITANNGVAHPVNGFIIFVE